MATMRERMLAGEPYMWDDELAGLHARARALMERLDATPYAEHDARRAIQEELFGELAEDANVRAGLRVDYGVHTRIGPRTFINYDCTILDCAAVTIGADCQIATRVQLLTAEHPVDPEDRASGWESARPIVLEDGVWLGGGVIVLPGVTIGAGTVVGAGAVVAQDLPPRVVAVGVPARVVREL